MTEPVGPPIVDYAAPYGRPKVGISAAGWCVLAANIALTLVSFYVVVKGANDEPYFSLKKADAMVQVGLGSALIAIWTAWSLTVLVLAARRVISFMWPALILWALVNVFYLSHGINGYLSDVIRFHNIGPSAYGTK